MAEPAPCCTPRPATENRKVGGSIPSLPTTSAQVKPSVAPAPLTGPAPDSGILPARPLTTAATGGPPGTLRQRSHHATVEDRHRHSKYLRGDCQGSREPVGLAAPAWWSWSSCSGHESPLTYPILLSGYTLHACSTPTNNAAHNSGPAAGGSSGKTQPHEPNTRAEHRSRTQHLNRGLTVPADTPKEGP